MSQSTKLFFIFKSPYLLNKDDKLNIVQIN